MLGAVSSEHHVGGNQALEKLINTVYETIQT
jgi:hypothetical protein